MLEHLFVYGTLAPGEVNHHWLEALAGTWVPATALGKIESQTKGQHTGLPCFTISESETVKGQIFSSSELQQIWENLDKFEGEDYVRQLVTVTTYVGKKIEAYVYIDKKSLPVQS